MRPARICDNTSAQSCTLLAQAESRQVSSWPPFPTRNIPLRPALERTVTDGTTAMLAFLRRLTFHYGIYRRYPLRPVPALRNAWRIAR